MPGWLISNQYEGSATMTDGPATKKSGLNEYNEVVVTSNMETVHAFSSCVIPMKVENAYMGECLNVMTQVLQTKDSSLLQGLTMQNAYTDVRKGSKNAVVVVKNSMTYPQTPKKKTPIPRAVATSAVQELPMEIRLLGRGRTGLKALTHLNWLLDRDKGSYLKS